MLLKGKTVMSASVLLVFFNLCYIIHMSLAQFTVPVLSTNDIYPIHSTDNKTEFSDRICSCSPFTVTQWSAWSVCAGSNQRSFRCHNGLSFKARSCRVGLLSENCIHRVWRYCYHETSCNGQWVEWVDPQEVKSCSRSCGGGVRVRVKLCMVDGEIGLFCASTQRKPYDVIYEVCNNHSCPATATIKSPTTVTIKSPTMLSTAEPPNKPGIMYKKVGQYDFNILTWLFVAVSVGLLLIVCILSVCLIVTKARLKKTHFKPIPSHLNNQVIRNGTPTSPDYQHLQHHPMAIFATSTPNSSSLNHLNGSLSSTTRPVKMTSQSPGSSTPRFNTPSRSLQPPIPPPVLTGSFTDLSGDGVVTSDVASFSSSVDVAEYEGTSYLKTMPKYSKGAKFRVADDLDERPMTSQRSDKRTFDTGDSRFDDDNHLYAEIPK